ncbi:MAG: DUF2953 domain-containing protein [Paenibacillaceae bacterium]|nr:DUF2953 domain-containing protein [Paenibacillaceae bacterium]
MGWVYAAAAALVAIAVALGYSQVQLSVYFSRVESDDRLELSVRALYGLFRRTVNVPVIQFEGLLHGVTIKQETGGFGADREADDRYDLERIRGMYRDFRLLAEHADDLQRWTRRLLARIRCTEMRWQTRIGIGDAAATAFVTGILWGLQSSALGFVARYFDWRAKPELNVQPQYNRVMFNTELKCIAKIRLGNAMGAAIRLLLGILKVKGGIRTWQSILFKAS